MNTVLLIRHITFQLYLIVIRSKMQECLDLARGYCQVKVERRSLNFVPMALG